MPVAATRHYPKQFEESFEAFLLGHKLKESGPFNDVAPIYALVGEPGTGKTSGILAKAADFGCKITMISGKDCASQLEGQGSAMFVNAVIEAGKDDKALLHCVMIDDCGFGGLAEDEDVTRTVNGPQLTGTLMGYADTGKVMKDDGRSAPRLVKPRRTPPLILTANRTDNLNEALLRDGRTMVVELSPDEEDKIRIVAGMYPRIGIKNAEKLTRRFPAQRPAFFAALKSEVAKQAILSMGREYNGRLADVNWSLTSRHVAGIVSGAAYDQLVRAGDALIRQEKSRNYLKRSSSRTKPVPLPCDCGVEYADFGDLPEADNDSLPF